jgi:hypothetical protein
MLGCVVPVGLMMMEGCVMVECQSKNSCNEVATILVSDGKTQMFACNWCCEIQTIEKENE